MDIVGGVEIHTCTDTLKEVIREAAEFWSLLSFLLWDTKLFITSTNLAHNGSVHTAVIRSLISFWSDTRCSSAPPSSSGGENQSHSMKRNTDASSQWREG